MKSMVDEEIVLESLRAMTCSNRDRQSGAGRCGCVGHAFSLHFQDHEPYSEILVWWL